MEITKEITPYHHKVIMRDDNGKAVSWLTLTREDSACFYEQLGNLLLKPNGSVLYLSDFGTARAHRHKGYGRELLECALSEYSADIIYLGVSSCDSTFSNKDLVKFYERVGFKKINYDFPYQFMVYDKLGKISDEELTEKIVKIKPELFFKSNRVRRYILPGIECVVSNGGIDMVASCALLKHARHTGYCQLFAKQYFEDKIKKVYTYELYPLMDKDGNEILIKWNYDNMNVYVSKTYQGHKWYCELETDSLSGLDT
jgi:GNAT superfamily N-acetyltransferase